MTHIAFLGGGNMSTAIISGMVKQGFTPQKISVVEHRIESRENLSNQLGVNTYATVKEVTIPDVWVLAVKPQNMRDALTELTPLLSQDQLLISIAAGLTIETLTQWSGNHSKIARTMPNTPAMVGQGVAGIYAPRPKFSEAEQGLIDRLFKAVGSTVWLKTEDEINAITAISGSGPAYVFYMMEHLAAAAVSLGFDEAAAQSLAKDTFAGAIALANNSPDSFATLRGKVTSKGGTTAAALATFDEHGVGKGLQSGALAATRRAEELAIELAK